MANLPAPGLLRSIDSLDPADLEIKIRTAGVVISTSHFDSTLVIQSSNASKLIVDAQIPISQESFINSLPQLADRIIIIGYLHLSTVRERSSHPPFPSNYTLRALIIKQAPGLDLNSWEKSLEMA